MDMDVSSIEMKASMRVSLFIPQAKNDDMSVTLSLSSVIEEITEDCILIQMPTYHGYFYPLPHDPIVMRFMVDSKPYSLPVLFDGRLELEKFTVAKMLPMGPITRHQLREHYRMECSMPISIEFPKRKRTGSPPKPPTIEGRFIDISEGGALLLTSEPIEREEEVVISFDIGTPEIINALVVRVFEIEQGKFKYKVGIKFKHRDKGQPGRIYRYIVQMQREQMKRM